MVADLVDNPNAPEPNTLQEMQAWGVHDPVPYEFGYADVSHGIKIKDCNAFWQEIKDIGVFALSLTLSVSFTLTHPLTHSHSHLPTRTPSPTLTHMHSHTI